MSRVSLSETGSPSGVERGAEEDDAMGTSGLLLRADRTSGRQDPTVRLLSLVFFYVLGRGGSDTMIDWMVTMVVYLGSP